MSTKGYFKLNPAMKKVYEARVRRAKEKDFKLLSDSILIISAFFGVIGVCMASFELLIGAGAMMMLSKLTANE
ncbi:MAG: hypothetical protein Q4B31_00790 [Clostridia bacterium]|nr:hypothetical protein [Clostridia bacterium]